MRVAALEGFSKKAIQPGRSLPLFEFFNRSAHPEFQQNCRHGVQ